MPVVSLGMFVVLILYSPFGVSDVEDRIHMAHEYGIQLERPITAITHAFIHADVDHWFWNTLLLLSYGINAEFQQKKGWQLGTIIIATPLGFISAIVYQSALGNVLDEPTLGSSVILSAMVMISVSGTARYYLQRYRRSGSYWAGMIVSGTLAIAIFVTDTKLLTTWHPSQFGHASGLMAGILIVAVRTLCGGKEMTPDTIKYFDRLHFIYEKKWESTSGQMGALTARIRAMWLKYS